jgi:hypothetical protein
VKRRDLRQKKVNRITSFNYFDTKDITGGISSVAKGRVDKKRFEIILTI